MRPSNAQSPSSTRDKFSLEDLDPTSKTLEQPLPSKSNVTRQRSTSRELAALDAQAAAEASASSRMHWRERVASRRGTDAVSETQNGVNLAVHARELSNSEAIRQFGISTVMNAKYQELKSWVDNGVFKEVADNGQPAITTRWVIVQKLSGKLKARLAARGFQDREKDIIAKVAPTSKRS